MLADAEAEQSAVARETGRCAGLDVVDLDHDLLRLDGTFADGDDDAVVARIARRVLDRPFDRRRSVVHHAAVELDHRRRLVDEVGDGVC